MGKRRFAGHMGPPYCSVVSGHESSKPFECSVKASFSHKSLLTQGVQDVSEPMHHRYFWCVILSMSTTARTPAVKAGSMLISGKSSIVPAMTVGNAGTLFIFHYI